MVSFRWPVVVWDLDDTLILERDYVRSGFEAVAGRLEAYGADPQVAFSTLWDGFLAGTRGDAFDRLLTSLGLAGAVPIETLVEWYRSHQPKIRIEDGLLRLLGELRRAGISQAVITDGALTGQRAKAAAVGLADLVDHIVFTDVWGRGFWKPHPRAFAEVEERFGVQPEDCIYIGDNPAKDFLTPLARGWDAVRLVRDGQLHAAVASPGVQSVKDAGALARFLQLP